MLTNSQIGIEARSIPVPESGCWLWLGPVDTFGYGKSPTGRRKEAESAHRASYRAFKGSIPEGMLVRHRCDTPRCVNPAHLLTGTHYDNMQDMLSRGRGRWGHRPAEPGHCVHGHALAGDNLRVCKGEKICRACNKEACRRYHARKRAAMRAQA